MAERLTRLEISSPGNATEAVGRALWVLEDARHRTKRTVADLPTTGVGWTASPGGHTIGSLLYHIAATEMEWICVDLLGQRDFAPTVAPWLAPGVRDGAGRLVEVPRESLAAHVRRLDATRAYTLAALEGMTVAEFRQHRPGVVHDVTAEWIVHHLAQHEAEHRGQIAAIKAVAMRASNAEGRLTWR